MTVICLGAYLLLLTHAGTVLLYIQTQCWTHPPHCQ